MLLNSKNLIFSAQRIDLPSAWQMPQGGIEKNESELDAAYRELYEETSIAKKNVEILQIVKEWILYDIPKSLVPKLWDGRYRGQTQKWFLFRYKGTDKEINIHTENPEFLNWRWSTKEQLIDSIVPFKRSTYIRLVNEFTSYLD